VTYTLADFLQRALVWPDPDDPSGWVNLHWRRQDQKGITGGQAFKTQEEVVKFIKWATGPKGSQYVADLYYCTSLQKDHGDPKQNGRYSAVRSIDNALSSKLLFADVDKYPSKGEALAAIKSFCEVSGSPYPTALVDSGGGLHAYWILPAALSKDLWLETASRFDGLLTQHGLKHDNISTDMARILRPPETLNYKRNKEGDKVQLLDLNGDINLDAWKSLRYATPTQIVVRDTKILPVKNLFISEDLAKTGPSARALTGKDDLPMGGGTVEPAPVLALCPMFKDALATGGKDVGQPVWHQQALACTFLMNGRKIFHQLGNQHGGYTPTDSDAMFDRKFADRQRIGLGYPSCAAFEADGAPQCKTCPLKGKITSPLNAQPEPTHAVADAEGEITSARHINISEQAEVTDKRPPLPPEEEFPDCIYLYNEDGFICFKEKGKNKKPIRLFMSKILDGEAYLEERGNSYGLRVLCTLDRSRPPVWINIAPSSFDDVNMGAYKALNQGGCLVMQNSSKVTQLMCYFRGRLAMESTALRNIPYGWEYPERKEGEYQGSPRAFAYGGHRYAPDGVRQAHGGDEELKDTYCVTGLPEPWLDAVRAIQSMGSPAHDAIVLSAFAAPLMIFSGQPSTVVMVRGDSGGGKSTASAIACAVWARPRTGVIKPNSSKLGLMKRMGRIRHLPTIWDDIRNTMFDTVKDTLMEITQGGDGLKLDANRKEREQGMWDNMLLTSSNNSLAEYLEMVSKQDGAALVRCFEFEVPPILQGEKGYLDFNVIAPLVASLDHNHGHIGREYAKLLGSSPTQLDVQYRKLQGELMYKVHPYQPHERYWMAAIATLLMAAELVNSLPSMANAQFDLAALEKFLVETYLAQRFRLKDADIHSGKSQFVKHHLSMFINNYAALRSEIIWTSDAPQGRGAPDRVAPLWPTGSEARSMKRVSVRWLTSTRQVRISKPALDEYLRNDKVSVDRVRDGLTKFYAARLNRGRIAAGLDNIAAQGVEKYYEIDVLPNSWMEKNLNHHAVKDPPTEIGRPQLGQNPDQSGTRPQPGQTGPANGKDAS